MEGGMRPGFNPRFDGPDEFFRGPPGAGPLRPPGMFDEPHHPRHRRHDDRRRHRPEFDDEPGPERPERRSRWSSGSPKFEENFDNREQNEEQNAAENGANAEVREASEDAPREGENAGNTTPLHDEPRDVQVSEEIHENAAEESGNVESENVVQETEGSAEASEQNETEQ